MTLANGAPSTEQSSSARRAPTLVGDVMTREVQTCDPGDTLDRVARLMWDHDCGAIPVVDDHGCVVGMVTDRDISMAAYIQGRALREIPVSAVHTIHVHCIRADASIGEAHHLMKMHRVRRLPVVDFGGNLVGILSLADVVRHARTSRTPEDPLHVENVATTLADVFRPSSPPPSTRPPSRPPPR